MAPLLLCILLTACASIPSPSMPFRSETERGVASWYGSQYHGRQTASGEVFDMEAMTAAHPSLPFGTQVRVYNRNNGESVDVTINDRGPFVRGRIIDLSRGAAQELGMVRDGVVPVEVRVLEMGDGDVQTARRSLGEYLLPWRWF